MTNLCADTLRYASGVCDHYSDTDSTSEVAKATRWLANEFWELAKEVIATKEYESWQFAAKD